MLSIHLPASPHLLEYLAPVLHILCGRTLPSMSGMPGGSALPVVSIWRPFGAMF